MQATQHSKSSLLLKKLNFRMEKKLKRDCSFASRLRMIFPTDSNLNTLEKSINIVKDYVVLSAGVDSLFFFCLRFSF